MLEGKGEERGSWRGRGKSMGVAAAEQKWKKATREKGKRKKKREKKIKKNRIIRRKEQKKKRFPILILGIFVGGRFENLT